MSDNIDYAELDKAVNEAIKNRSNTAKPTTKPATATPVKRPHGQFMDIMGPQRPTPHMVKPVAKAPVKPAVKPVARPIAKPVATKVITAPRPAIATRSAKIGTATRPVRPSVASQIQQKQQHVVAKPVAKPTVKPVTKTVTPAKPVAKPAPATAKKPEPKKETPNANNYSLGVRSPFMTNTKVEKRPLGTDIPETSATALRSTKNIYSSKSPSKSSKADKKHMVTEAPKKHSGWLWTLIVLLVIAAGGGLGYLAYIMVFANQL